MKLCKHSLICLAIAAALSGCNDDDEKIVQVPTDMSPVVAQGKTLTNTPDVVVKSTNEVDNLTITIGATSDLHGRIFGYDYAMDREDSDAGLTRIATLLEQEKAKDPNIILIDIGDTVQGNSAQLFNDDPTHPVVSSLNALDFDVWVPGNHEFNFERSFVDRNLEHFNGAVLSSNIKWESNDVSYIRGYQVFEIDGARVAVVGLTPSNVPNWEASAPSHFAGLKFEEELDATRAAVDELTSKFQPDVIVGALHLGRKGENGNGVYGIASALADKFDVILAGHEHATYIEKLTKGDEDSAVDISADGKATSEDKSLAGIYDETTRRNSVKIIEPGKWGWALAKAEIKLKKEDNGKWQMVDTSLANLTTKDVDQDTALAAQFQYVDDMAKADAQEVIGKVVGNFTPTPTGLQDEVTHTGYSPEAGRLYSTIHYAKVVDTPLMDLINQLQMQKSGATVSAASLFSDTSNLVDGQDYAKKDSTNLYKYDNTLLGVNMTGEKLKLFMEWSYGYFNGYKTGDLTVSFRKGAKAYLYDQFDGAIQYTVDLTGDAFAMDDDNQVTNPGSRIVITEIDGQPFDPKAVYKVAMNSYRFGSQVAKYGWASSDDVFYDSVNEPVYAIRDMLTQYVVDHKGLNVDDFDDNINWSFKQYADMQALRAGEGKALWDKLVNMEVCIKIDEDNPKYPGITYSVNINDATSYFDNPAKDAATLDEKYAGCAPK